MADKSSACQSGKSPQFAACKVRVKLAGLACGGGGGAGLQTGVVGSVGQLGQGVQVGRLAGFGRGGGFSLNGMLSQALIRSVASRTAIWIFRMALVRVLNLPRSIPAP